MKRMSSILYNAVFWIPFVFGLLLCQRMLSDPASSWPAFYSFLPMTFFFIGAAFMILVGRIRKIEKMLESRESAAAPDSRVEGNQTLFDDPVGWSRSAVGTWPRFWFMAVCIVALQFALVFVTITGGWFPASGLAVILAGFQLMFLFALRRLLPTKARDGTNANGAA